MEIKELPRLTRTMALELDRSALSEASPDEPIPVALSSETPVERWFGTEILDHAPGSIDLSRAQDGLPLLLDHDTREQIGVIEGVAVDEDRVVRGRMRFSRSARAQEIRQDVLDGIRRSTSIGYQIREMKLAESDKKKGDTYRATRWSLLEGSLVAVPADPSVGAYREASQGDAYPVKIIPHEPAPTGQEIRMDETVQTAPAGAAPAPVQVNDRAVEDRAAAIVEVCTAVGKAERAAEFLRSGASVREVGEALRREAETALQQIQSAGPQLSDKEQRRYSLSRAIMAQASGDWSKAGFEREISQEAEKYVPSSYQRRGGFLMPGTIGVRTAIAAGTTNAADDLVFTEPGSFIELLRKKMKVRQLGATVLSGLRGPVAFPKQSGAGTAYWLGESSAVTESNLTTTQVALNPKTVRARQAYTKQLLAEGIMDVDNMVRADLATIIALAIDSVSINGGGTNEPSGILQTSGIGSVAIGTNGGVPTYAHMVDLETEIAADDAEAAGMAFLTTPGIRGKLRKTEQFATTNGMPVWTGGFEGEVNGYRALVSNQVPSNLTKGTASGTCHAVIFGNWPELVIGEWGTLEITADPYSRGDYGEIVVRTFSMVGLAVRHAESFAAIKDALTA